MAVLVLLCNDIIYQGMGDQLQQQVLTAIKELAEVLQHDVTILILSGIPSTTELVNS